MPKERKPEVIAVVGAQWGDEGKGKIVDMLAEDADLVIRAQGGDNAGHTVINDKGEFAFNLLPSSILYPHVRNQLGSGVVLNPDRLIEEIHTLTQKGLFHNNLNISDRAQILMPYHVLQDRLQELARGSHKIGTTGKGIGPAYTDMRRRIGPRMEHIMDEESFLWELKSVLPVKREDYEALRRQIRKVNPEEAEVLPSARHIPELNLDFYEHKFLDWETHLKDIIVDSDEVLEKYLKNKSKIILEGAQATLLDVTYGTRPNVTSSSTTINGLMDGAGIPAGLLSKAIGVFKVYQTRVGSGGMPTELLNEVGDHLREVGHEYGTTTGRPRRVGYFDGVAARYAHLRNNFNEIALLKADVATGVPLRICNEYAYMECQKLRFPSSDLVLSHCIARYQMRDYYDAWYQDLANIRDKKDLPEEFLEFTNGVMENLPGAKLTWIGVGPSRDAIIKM